MSGAGSMRFSFLSRMPRFLPHVFFFVSLFLFLFFSIRDLNWCFPFEVDDEYYKFQVALRIMHVFLGQAECGDLLTVPAHPLAPFLMYHDYVGWPTLYVSVVLMSVLGKTLGYFFVFRLSTVLFGALALVSIWVVLKRWFDDWTAALTVFFVGCNYSYIQSVQHGFFREEVFQICGLWSGLALCLTAQRRKNSLFLYAGFFVFGLTLWAKIMFVAYIIGALAVFSVTGRRGREFIGSVFLSFRRGVVAGFAFILGAAPFVWFNVRNGFPTFRLMVSRVSNLSDVHDDWNNSAVFENVLRRVHDFYLYLSGEILFGFDSTALVFAALFVCAIVWAAAVFALRRLGDDGLRFRLRVLFVFYGAVLILTCFLPFRHASGHILMLAPFAGILCALFLVRITRLRTLLFVPVLLCGLWFNEQLDHMYMFSHSYIQEGRVFGLLKGEHGFLTAWVKSKNIKRVLCSNPLARVIGTTVSECDIRFYDVGYIYAEPAAIADDLRRFICELPEQESYMLICRGENSAVYTKIKDSAESHGIRFEIVDSKLLRKNPAHTFLLCRITLPDEKNTKAPVS